MFARKYRLPAKVQLKNPLIVSSSLFLLKFARNELDYNRYGFIVSKSIDKRSSVRNRIKRRVRSCLEKMHAKLAAGYDFLFIIKKEALSQETKDLFTLIEKIFIKEGLLQN